MLAAAAVAAALAPARFAVRPGWHAGTGRVHACPGITPQRCRQVVSWAATAAWRDCAECLPHRTLARLPADGIAMQVSLAVERPFPDWLRREPWPPRIDRQLVRSPFEGLPERIGVYQWSARVGSLEAAVMVFFGRARPTARQLAAAQTELRAAALP